jgi:DNA-binding transcriptional ArsR family regulator
MAKKPLSILPEQEYQLSASETFTPATLVDLNRTIHEPARLAILTVLSGCVTADFKFLQTATGLSKGNLSVQLTRLEEVALVEIVKTIERKHTLTTVSLTREGRSELSKYWRQMDRIRNHSTRAIESTKKTVAAKMAKSSFAFQASPSQG